MVRENVIVSAGPALVCVPAASQSSGEAPFFQPSPDDGPQLPDIQLRGSAGPTSADRSLGLWSQPFQHQAKVKHEGEGGSPS